MSPGITEIVISNGAEDIGTTIHLTNSAVILSECCNEMRSMRPGFQRSQLLLHAAPAANNQRLKAWPRGLRPLRCSFAGLKMTRICVGEANIAGQAPPLPRLATDAGTLQTRDAIQKMLNRCINSWRAS